MLFYYDSGLCGEDDYYNDYCSFDSVVVSVAFEGRVSDSKVLVC